MMQSISTFLLASALFGAATVMAGSPVNEGCSSSITGMTLNGTYDYNSAGKCGDACSALNYVAFATQYKECYCGQTFPPSADVISDSTCSITCPGYPSDLCGGASAYSFYTTGLTTSVSYDDPSSASTTLATTTTKVASSSTATAKASVVTVGGQTIVVTATAQSATASASSSATSSPSSSGPSKAGIAAGVVVGLIAIAAIAGGLFLFFRNKQRREIEEEHKRQAAVSSFVDAGKPPVSSAGSATDTRLDPVYFAQRRVSDGSIADNQDYSRKILKVTNA